MRLISLSANRASFRSVTFNRTGLSLVVARQQAPSQSRAKTYNGVGKSLLLNLLHFCTGAKPSKDFLQKLAGWSFALTFEHCGKERVLERSVDSHKEIRLDGQKERVSTILAILEGDVFPEARNFPNVSFRTLFPNFARPFKESYVRFNWMYRKEDEYTRLMRAGYLLGLNLQLIRRKHDLTVDRRQIEEMRRALEQDTYLREFFTEGKDVDLEIRDLSDRISELEERLRNFQVAENYNEVRARADELARQQKILQNRIFTLENQIEAINASLSTRADLTPEEVKQIYDEAQTALPAAVVKTLEEVSAFQQALAIARIRRLTTERANASENIQAAKQQLVRVSADLDACVGFLGTHGALDEFVLLTNSASDAQAKRRKLDDYKGLVTGYATELQRIAGELAQENVQTAQYLADAQPLTDSLLTSFRNLSKRFYPDKPGGIVIKNNDRDNQLRFDLDVKIQDDASDGINEIKIFCYDLTVLLSKHRHRMSFLFHDSRLLADVDPRQRAALLGIASAIREKNLQYIATINQDQLESIRPHMDAAEYDAMLRHAIVLEPTDESPAHKLLGVQLDLQYE